MLSRRNAITIGCRVKGPHGALIPNPRGHGRRVREVITGEVIQSVGNNQYKVRFDIDGREISCSSRSLKVIERDEGIPVNEVTVGDTQSFEPILHDHEEVSSDDEEIPNGDWDLADEMLKYLDTEETERHKNNYDKAWEEIHSLAGQEVTIKADGVTTVWTVVDEVEPFDEDLSNSDRYCGLWDEDYSSDKKLIELFLNLWPGDIFKQLENLNLNLVEVNYNRKKSLKRRPIKDVTRNELITFIALVIAASSSPLRGTNLWNPPNNLFNKTIGYGKFMKEYRFKEIKTLFPMLFWNKEARSSDPWWKFRTAVDEFNRTRKEMINVSSCMVMDESMSSIIPRTT